LQRVALGDEIPMGQGFYVHVTAAVNLNVTESIKTNGSQALLKLANRPTLRVEIRGGNKKDEALLYLESGATSSFDLEYDAYEMGNGNPAHPVLAFRVDSLLLQVSGVAPVTGSYTTALLARTGSERQLHHLSHRAFTFPAEGLHHH
jgi:hypothetical protein